MNIKQEVRGLLVKEQDGGAASMSTNRSHKHGLSIDTMWDDLKPQVHQVIKKYFAEHNLSVKKLKPPRTRRYMKPHLSDNPPELAP